MNKFKVAGTVAEATRKTSKKGNVYHTIRVQVEDDFLPFVLFDRHTKRTPGMGDPITVTGSLESNDKGFLAAKVDAVVIGPGAGVGDRVPVAAGAGDREPINSIGEDGDLPF